MDDIWRRLWQGAIITLWAVGIGALWRKGHITAAFALALTGGLVVFVLLQLALRHLRRRAREDAQLAGDHAPNSPHAGRVLVTRMLCDLTRVQVAYLSQTFHSTAEARSWLKNALPRAFRGAMGELRRDLEAAREGESPPSLKLAREVIALHQRMQPADECLDDLAKSHPDHAVARPVAFVITEHIDPEDPQSAPLVASAAGWDPEQPTLLPTVEVLTIVKKVAGRQEVCGQVDFAAARQIICRNTETKVDLADGTSIYITGPLANAEQPSIKTYKIPLGFMVGTAELL